MEDMPSRSPAGRAAAVCYRRVGGSIQFLLVQTAGGRWTFPKGRVEAGETPWQAAQREALEEAGVRGDVSPHLLTTYTHQKRTADRRATRVMVAAYLLRVESDSDAAEPGRSPTWFEPQEARKRLALKRDAFCQASCTGVIDLALARLSSDNAGPQD